MTVSAPSLEQADLIETAVVEKKQHGAASSSSRIGGLKNLLFGSPASPTTSSGETVTPETTQYAAQEQPAENGGAVSPPSSTAAPGWKNLLFGSNGAATATSPKSIPDSMPQENGESPLAEQPEQRSSTSASSGWKNLLFGNTHGGETAASPQDQTQQQPVVNGQDAPLSPNCYNKQFKNFKRTLGGFSPEIKKKGSGEDGPLKILFLSADTGGGHRASAESLGKQFQLIYKNVEYELLDTFTTEQIQPYKVLVDSYGQMSANPWQWRVVYHSSNGPLTAYMFKNHLAYISAHKIKKRIEAIDPDIIVCVHPAMVYNHLIVAQEIAKERKRPLPFFVVITDLGSGHRGWFEPNVDKVYVASDWMHRAALDVGTPNDRIVRIGLPIRHDFAIQAEALGDRTMDEGWEYIASTRQALGLESSGSMVLVMAGGEGVGSLDEISLQLYRAFSKAKLEVTICVVCGKNAALKEQLAEKDWDAAVEELEKKNAKKRNSTPFMNPKEAERQQAQQQQQQGEGRFSFLKKHRLFSNGDTSATTSTTSPDNTDSNEEQESASSNGNGNHVDEKQSSKVQVVPLGFVTKMAEYMVAANVLVSKAGPGTIAEAASLGLPVLLTNFLPGQEAGNVDFVLEGGFGAYEESPPKIARIVTSWLQDPRKLNLLSKNAASAGHANAAQDIVKDIGSSALKIFEEGVIC